MSSDSFRSLKGPFNWINNARVNPLKAIGSIDNLSPRTGISIADVPVSGQEEVDRAVQAAKDAFGSWKSLSGADRGRILLKTAELVRQNVEELAKNEVLDNGKPIWEARQVITKLVEIAFTISFYYIAEWTWTLSLVVLNFLEELHLPFMGNT